MVGSSFALVATLLLPVPFVAQQKDTCGAASLAMVLRYWQPSGSSGGPVSQAQIAKALFEPSLEGIPGSRLAAFARDRGMTAIAYEGDRAQLRDYLAKGRPLIVAWKVGRRRYHNVVVTGYDEDRQELVVNDPARGAERHVDERTFEKRWAGAGHWTLLVLPEEDR